MEPRKVALVAHSDDLSSDLGLFILGTEGNERIYAARETGLLAHDVLDHYPMPMGTVSDELRALGSIYYGRGRYSHIQIQSDIHTSWDDLETYGDSLEEVEVNIDPEVLSDIRAEVLSATEGEFGYPVSEEILEATAKLIAEGYAEAEKRWPDPLDHFEAHAAIERLEMPELRYEGQLFVLIYDARTASIEEME